MSRLMVQVSMAAVALQFTSLGSVTDMKRKPDLDSNAAEASLATRSQLSSEGDELAHPPRPLAVRSTVGSAIWFHSAMLALSLIVVGLSVTMRVPGEEQVYLPGVNSPVPGMCASRQLFGFNCPGCGLTRSFICIGHGHFARAWHFNPGSFVFFFFVAAQIPWRIAQLILIGTGRGERWIGVFDWLPWVVAAALVIQWILRTLF